MAFARVGEVEEAPEALELSGETKGTSRRACFFPSHSPDLHLKTQGRPDRPDFSLYHQTGPSKERIRKSEKMDEDDLLPQLLESTIDLVTGKEAYSDPYAERLANPSLSSTKVLTARGVTRLSRGEISEARSDPEKAISQEGANDETITAYAIAVTEKIQQGRRRRVVE